MAQQVILYNGMLNIGSDISYKFIKHMGHSKKLPNWHTKIILCVNNLHFFFL